MDKDVKKNLIDVGFMAAARGWREETECIFAGVEKILPESPAPCLGRSLVQLTMKEYGKAIEILEKGRDQFKESPEIKAFLGLAYHLAGEQAKVAATLMPLAEQKSPVGRMATSILNEKGA